MKDMANVIIDNNDQCKRRLPTWMQSINTSKDKCGNLDGICSTAGEAKETHDTVYRIECMSGQIDAALVENKKDPEVKKKILKNHSKKLKLSDNFEESTHNYVRSKRKSKEAIIEITTDEAELTVEDLISIAEEFLHADNVMQHEQPVLSKSNSSESNSIPMNALATLEGNLNAAFRTFKSLSKCSQISSSHLSTLEHNPTAETASFSSNKTTQSGDAAKDMLELFLGPLLNNAPLRRTDSEITSDTELNV